MPLITVIILRIRLVLLEQAPQFVFLLLGPAFLSSCRASSAASLVAALHVVALADRLPEEELCVDFGIFLGGHHKLSHHVNGQLPELLGVFRRWRIQHLLEQAEQPGLEGTAWRQWPRKQKQQLIILQLSGFLSLC